MYLTDDVYGHQHKYHKYVFEKFVYNQTTSMSANYNSRYDQSQCGHVAAVSFYHGCVVLDKQPCDEYRAQLRTVKRGNEWKPIRDNQIQHVVG